MSIGLGDQRYFKLNQTVTQNVVSGTPAFANGLWVGNTMTTNSPYLTIKGYRTAFPASLEEGYLFIDTNGFFNIGGGYQYRYILGGGGGFNGLYFGTYAGGDSITQPAGNLQINSSVDTDFVPAGGDVNVTGDINATVDIIATRYVEGSTLYATSTTGWSQFNEDVVFIKTVSANTVTGNIVTGGVVYFGAATGNTVTGSSAYFGKETMSPPRGGYAFNNYAGVSSDNANNNISTWTVATIAGYVRVEINGTTYWMPYYAAPTS